VGGRFVTHCGSPTTGTLFRLRPQGVPVLRNTRGRRGGRTSWAPERLSPRDCKPAGTVLSGPETNLSPCLPRHPTSCASREPASPRNESWTRQSPLVSHRGFRRFRSRASRDSTQGCRRPLQGRTGSRRHNGFQGCRTPGSRCGCARGGGHVSRDLASWWWVPATFLTLSSLCFFLVLSQREWELGTDPQDVWARNRHRSRLEILEFALASTEGNRNHNEPFLESKADWFFRGYWTLAIGIFTLLGTLWHLRHG
jgi:hypothetical protein